ncbi:hypothetical protein [Cognatiluteimonas weifangensis]|uniref:hypothetical protein n=1 Tax=Cognatiluteimonas weifangensis TaxID=2303539 RepID=UPI0011C0D21F|nr:hypothetical protein [Luteimonas weifangensis]
MQDLEVELSRLRKSHNRLKVLVGSILLCMCSALLIGATLIPGNATFASIDVQRINIREPDGTLRLTISNKSSFPGAFIKNKEVKHPRDVAGFLFFNDEGTEQGGLIYNGRLASNGKPSSGLSLTFDRYQQDQQMQLLGVDDDGTHFAGLTFNDVADGLERPVFSAKDKAESAAGNHAITKRLFLGKGPSQNSTLQLLDGEGKPRLELRVTPAGEARIVFLDPNGKPTREITGER